MLEVQVKEEYAAILEPLQENVDAALRQYSTGLWQENGGLTRENEKSCGYLPAFRTVQACEHCA